MRGWLGRQLGNTSWSDIIPCSYPTDVLPSAPGDKLIWFYAFLIICSVERHGGSSSIKMIYEQAPSRPVLKSPPSKHHLSCPLIAFNLAITQQSCQYRAAWNDTRFHFVQNQSRRLHQTVLCVNRLNHKPFWILGLAGFLSFPEDPLCFPYTNYWQCHLQRDFQHGSAPWHQTLAWCTKETKSFSMTHAPENTLSPTFRKYFTSKLPL